MCGNFSCSYDQDMWEDHLDRLLPFKPQKFLHECVHVHAHTTRIETEKLLVISLI